MTAAIYETGPEPSPTEGRVPDGPAGSRAWCVIDRAALRHNAAQLRARAGVPLVPMVKADAYGLGMHEVARALGAPFHGEPPSPDAPWALGVATVEEGEALRALGASGRVLCTSPVLRDELPRVAAAGITPSLHREPDVHAWRALTSAPWHLGIDTGMQRAGVGWRHVAALQTVVAAHPPEGVFTHFHSADRPNGSRELQEARFRAALETLALPEGTLRHTDNSWAQLARSPSPWELARPGIALYGVPGDSALDLHPVVHVHARVIDVHELAPGDTVSYDATYTAERARRIATVALGYGDGYRRALSNRAHMLLRGYRVPVTGLVTMDMTMLDVTDVPCEVGDVATALGAALDGSGVLTVDEVAAMGGVSPYELLVGWRLRLPRVYLP
jgi:alanine racemase